MKKIIMCAIFSSLAASPLTSCTHDDATEATGKEQPAVPGMQDVITIKVGKAEFKATLSDNATAKAFKARLPLRVMMQEHAGNEKFHTLPYALPTNAYQPGNISNGDLMLWGNNTVVLFYKSFTSSYSYTRIGKVDNPSQLATAVGSGDIEVTFEVQTTNE